MQIITARIRRMTESNIFSLSTLAGGGYPISGLDEGVPHLRSGQGGYPHPIWPPTPLIPSSSHSLLSHPWPRLSGPCSCLAGMVCSNVHFSLTSCGLNLILGAPLHAKIIFFTSHRKIPKIVVKQPLFHQ